MAYFSIHNNQSSLSFKQYNVLLGECWQHCQLIWVSHSNWTVTCQFSIILILIIIISVLPICRLLTSLYINVVCFTDSFTDMWNLLTDLCWYLMISREILPGRDITLLNCCNFSREKWLYKDQIVFSCSKNCIQARDVIDYHYTLSTTPCPFSMVESKLRIL